MTALNVSNVSLLFHFLPWYKARKGLWDILWQSVKRAPSKVPKVPSDDEKMSLYAILE